MSYLLAIDGGTGSVRAVLFDLKGTQVAAAARDWQHDADPRYPGSMDFVFDRNWQLITECVREVLDRAQASGDQVLALSTTAMREGIVLVDAQGKEVWACANVDARSEAQVAALARSGVEQQVYRKSGQTFALSSQPRLRWLKENEPELYERAATMLMLNDWIVYRFSGELSTEPSNGSTTGMINLTTEEFAPELAELCGIRSDFGAPVVAPGTQVGGVTAAAAAETGLRPGTPVVVGGGDAQLAAVALGVVRPYQALIVGGTFWQQEINIPQPITDDEMRVRVNCAASPELWQAEAIVFHPGTTVRWFRDAFYGAEVEQARVTGADVYDLMTAEAAQVPIGSNGIIPIFSDVMNYGRWFHAAPSFLNLSLDPALANRGAMFRSVLENAALVAAANLREVERFSQVSPSEVVFAGGAARSDVWSQILADVLGKPVKIPVVSEATALGAALCAGVGIGELSTVADAGEELVQWDRTIEPNSAATEQYQEIYERWQKAYPPQLELVQTGVTTSLWRAPGTQEEE